MLLDDFREVGVSNHSSFGFGRASWVRNECWFIEEHLGGGVGERDTSASTVGLGGRGGGVWEGDTGRGVDTARAVSTSPSAG